MDDLFLNEARTKFVGKADREKVATMFRAFSQKVVDLEYDSLPGWGVRHAEHMVRGSQCQWAVCQCLSISICAFFLIGGGVQAYQCMEERKEFVEKLYPDCLPPDYFPETREFGPRLPRKFGRSDYSDNDDLFANTGASLEDWWAEVVGESISPAVPFIYFAAAVLLFACCHLCTFLFYIRSPTYRARWYRCLTRAFCCKGLGNGPDPTNLKRSAVYPEPFFRWRHTRRGPQTRTAVVAAVPGKVKVQRGGVSTPPGSQQIQLADLEA
jgi:hypothetical protein